VYNMCYGQHFLRPAQLAVTGRAIGLLFGVTTVLSPDFNFVEVSTPYARNFLGLDAEGAGETLQDIFNQVLETGRILLTLPRSLEQVITKLETGQIEVKMNGNGGNARSRRRGRGRGERNNEREGGLSGFSWVLLFGAEMVGGVVR